ncbi:hypothetical protein D3Z52_03285 [Clostridiaceae bacterium]|nr:hypothetical protein [Clostridiaceae bacterium]
MRILFYELRKIWRLPVVLAVAALGTLTYFGFMHPLLFDGMLQSSPVAERYEITRSWAARFGAYMDGSEFQQAKAECKALRQEADAQVAANPYLSAYGITTLDGFNAFLDAGLDPKAHALINDFVVSTRHQRFWVSEMEGLLKNWETVSPYYAEYAKNPALTPAEQARYLDAAGSRLLEGIFCGLDGTLEGYFLWWDLFATLSTALLLAPCGAAEWLNRMPALQWATRTGRRTARYRLAAALLSAVGLFVLEALVFCGIYSASGTWVFWRNPVTSFTFGDVLWFDLTYGEYFLLHLALTLCLMLGTAGMVFTLSDHSSHYISALLKAVIPVTGFAAAGVFSVTGLLTSRNPIYAAARIMGIEAAVCAALSLLGLAAGLLPLFRGQRKELL